MHELYHQCEKWLFNALQRALPANVIYRNQVRGHDAWQGYPTAARSREHHFFALPAVLDHLEKYARCEHGHKRVGENGCLQWAAQFSDAGRGQSSWIWTTLNVGNAAIPAPRTCMTRIRNDTEVVRTYTITGQLSVRLTEIPRRVQFPTCACCGDGNYWHVTWPTGVVLARYLAAPARQRTMVGKQVLVIGCGLGLEAIVLAKLGASVSILDHIPAALELVAHNCVRNQLDPVTLHPCCWRDARALRRLPTYEVVIGSDVLYDTVAARGVTRLLTTVLKPRGKAIVADPLRSFRTSAETFVRLMTTAEFRLTSQWIRRSAYARACYEL
jgi:predicted nicotinamide N-methyase